MVDGNPVLSCLALNEAYACNEVQEPQIVTIEGLAQKDGLDPVQNAFDRCGALQCGFCQPGMMLSARALLQEKANPTIAEIRHALSGNLCRCTGYTKKILEACLMAAIQENENVDDEVAYEKMRENQKASQHFDTGPETKNGVAS